MPSFAAIGKTIGKGLVSATGAKSSGGGGANGDSGSGGGGTDYTKLQPGPILSGPNAKQLAKVADGDEDDDVDSYHKGGKVKKTGLARLKKGEHVLTKSQFKKMKSKGRMSK